jgi:hypothetical protein
VLMLNQHQVFPIFSVDPRTSCPHRQHTQRSLPSLPTFVPGQVSGDGGRLSRSSHWHCSPNNTCWESSKMVSCFS